MTADAATARDLGVLLWFAVGSLVLSVLLNVWFEGLIFNGCSSCAHCTNKRKLRDDEQERLRQEYERRWGLRPLEGEEKDEAPPSPGSSGDQDGGEGRSG